MGEYLYYAVLPIVILTKFILGLESLCNDLLLILTEQMIYYIIVLNKNSQLNDRISCENRKNCSIFHFLELSTLEYCQRINLRGNQYFPTELVM